MSHFDIDPSHDPFFTAHHLKTINDVKFTPREIDIIACLLSGKGSKTIAHFLSIEEKTVEAHKYNIMRKLECNSKEGIIHFVERSDKFSALKKHYLSLLCEAIFEKHLTQIVGLLANKKLNCSLIYEESVDNAPFITRLGKHLRLTGIKLHETIKEKNKPLDPILCRLDSQQINHIIYQISDACIAHLRVSKNQEKIKINDLIQKFPHDNNKKTILFISRSTEPLVYTNQEAEEANFLELSYSKNYYFFVFEILQVLFPRINLEETIINFRKQYEVIYDSADKALYNLWSQVTDLYNVDNLGHQALPSVFKKKMVSLLLVTISIMIGACFLYFNLRSLNFHLAHSSEIKPIRSDLTIPVEASLLHRTSLISQIEQKLKGRQGIQTIALIGPGGSGKTTLARQYAHQQKANVIWEINAETPRTIQSSFEHLAQVLATDKEDQKTVRGFEEIKNAAEREENIIYFVKAQLKARSYWVLIYDNVERISDIEKYFPGDVETWGQGKVILTTRDSSIQNNTHVDHSLQIGELTPEQKLILFTKIMNQGNSNAIRIIKTEELKSFLEKLSPFPLDISLAAYYIIETNTPSEKYIEHLKQNESSFETIHEEVLKQSSNYSKTRYQIISLSLKQLIDANEEFDELLLFSSLMDPQNIPRDLLDSYKNDIIVDNFIHYLKRYSLIKEQLFYSNNNEPVISFHRNTQDITLIYIIKTIKPERRHQLLISLTNFIEKYIFDLIDRHDYLKMSLLVNHCEIFLTHKNLLTSSEVDSISTVLGIMYYYLGNYLKAEEILRKTLFNLQKASNTNHEKIFWNLTYLGAVYRELCDYNKAKKLLEQSLLILKKHFPEKQISMAKTLRYLGHVHRSLGSYEIARKLFEQSLNIYEKTLPHNHIVRATTLRYLGMVHRSQGHYEIARNFFEQSLVIYKKSLPENHINYALALAYVGHIYRNLGNYQKSLTFLEKSLAIYKHNLSDNHINIAWMSVYLGILYRNLGDFEKSKTLHEKGLIIYKKFFSGNHIKIAWAMSHLGNIYSEMKDYDKAISLLEQSLVMYKSLFSDNHYEIARNQLYLANAYKGLGEYKKSKDLLRKTLAIYEGNYGTNHVDTARALGSLGQVYLLEGDLDVAENFIKKALVIFQASNHPKSHISLENLSDIYRRKSAQAASKGDINNTKYFKDLSFDSLKQALLIANNHFPKDSIHIQNIKSRMFELENGTPASITTAAIFDD